MNGSKYVITLFLLSMAMLLKAQSFTLSGKVSDNEGNAIELATISCLEQGAVTMANLKGEYSLKLHSADSVVVIKKIKLNSKRKLEDIKVFIHSWHNYCRSVI